MAIEFSQFVVGGTPVEGDIIVGLRAGRNTQFTYPQLAGVTWQVVTTKTVMSADNGYFVNSMGVVTLTTPATLNVGDSFEVVMVGQGSFIIQLRAGQILQAGNIQTTSGGRVTSLNQGDVIKFIAWSASRLIVLSGVTLNYDIS